MKRNQPKPLYRKVNRRPQYHRCAVASASVDAKNERGGKKGMSKKMTSKQHGLDYTPLYRFLHKHAGQKWDDVYRKIKGRIPTDEPIWHIVVDEPNWIPISRVGESTYFSQMEIVDGVLQFVDSDYTWEDYAHRMSLCSCCTHSFNGKAV